MEFPKYIQWDFLLVLMGLIFGGMVGYLYFVKGIFSLFLIFLLISSFVLFSAGFWEMMDNYYMEKKVRVLRMKVESKELKKQYKKLFK